jgi:hypothetical protein
MPFRRAAAGATFTLVTAIAHAGSLAAQAPAAPSGAPLGWRGMTVDLLTGGWNAATRSWADIGGSTRGRADWGALGALRVRLPLQERLALTVGASGAGTPVLYENQPPVSGLGDIGVRSAYSGRWFDATVGLEYRAPVHARLDMLVGGEAGYGRLDLRRSECAFLGAGVTPCPSSFEVWPSSGRMHGLMLAASVGAAWRVAPRLQLLGLVRPTITRAYAVQPRPWSLQVGARLGP